MAQLIVVEGANRGATVDLKSHLLIGSGSEADIRLDDRRASARQIEVTEQDGVFEIQNLDARHNLLVNGEVVRRRRRLSHGDWISFAETTFVFSDDVPRERKAIELSLEAHDLVGSRIAARRPLFDSAESVLESIDEDLPAGAPLAAPGPSGAAGAPATPARAPGSAGGAGGSAPAPAAPAASASGGTPRASPRAKDRLATLYRVSTAISSQLQLPLLLERILEICFEVFPVDRGFILLLNEDDRKLKCAASRLRDAPHDDGPHDISKTIVREVFQTREAIISVDASADERFLTGQSVSGARIRSVLCAPLVAEDRVIGVIQLDTVYAEHAFTEPDLSLLSAIAMQCAIAIENARAYKRRQEYSRSLIYLARATQRLSSFLNRDQIVRESVKSSCALLGCTKGSLLLVKGPADHRRLVLVYAVGMGRDLVQRLGAGSPSSHVYARRVIETGQPLLVPDVRQLRQHDDDRGASESQDHRYASQSFLIVPVFAAGESIEARGNAIGALCVTDKLNRASFNGNDQEVLQIIASQTGIALANAELYEKATIDTLTRVYVRRYFFQKLEVAVRNAHYTNATLGLLMIDLDHFKSVNDTYGHAAGDAVLRQLGKLLKRAVRADMTCARYGGEEFAIICPEVGHGVIDRVAERVRLAIWQETFRLPDGSTIQRTASIGAAVLERGEDHTRLLARADAALFRAKHGGRNRVAVAPPAGTPGFDAFPGGGGPRLGDGESDAEVDVVGASAAPVRADDAAELHPVADDLE